MDGQRENETYEPPAAVEAGDFHDVTNGPGNGPLMDFTKQAALSSGFGQAGPGARCSRAAAHTPACAAPASRRR